MATVLDLGPVTRVEGHLDVEVTVDTVGGKQQIVDARSSGTMFRGFENILIGRDPRDATQLTQRVCGVCPISHGMASSLALEAIGKLTPPANGRIMRNLILGANFVQSHILHFYVLSLPDYVDMAAAVNMSPWSQRLAGTDMITGPAATPFVQNYVSALTMRRKAHQMGAIWGGKLPCSPAILYGGCPEPFTSANVSNFLSLLSQLQSFINNVYIPDVKKIAAAFGAYKSIGKGWGNLLAYGAFDLDAAGTNKLLKRGRVSNGVAGTVDIAKISEFVDASYYTPASGNLNPANGVTQVDADKAGAYSFIKAPRYNGTPYELGPLARMWVNGDYTLGISVIDRMQARAAECKKVADAMAVWVNQITGTGSYTEKPLPSTGNGVGLTEAPRGALGHWVRTAAGKISGYQIITPTAWNGSPVDNVGQKGAIEKALIGVPVAKLDAPVEAVRVIHSFDPCLSCAVHMARPGKKAEVVLTA